MADYATKQDIKEIVTTAVEASEERLGKRLTDQMVSMEYRLASHVSREVSDLADINRAVLDEVSKVPKLDERLTRVERKVKLA